MRVTVSPVLIVNEDRLISPVETATTPLMIRRLLPSKMVNAETVPPVGVVSLCGMLVAVTVPDAAAPKAVVSKVIVATSAVLPAATPVAEAEV